MDLATIHTHVETEFPNITIPHCKPFKGGIKSTGLIYAFLPQGKSGLLWFTEVNGIQTSLFLGLDKNLNINNILDVKLRFNPVLSISRGTLYEATMLDEQTIVIYGIYYFKGTSNSNLANIDVLNRLILSVTTLIEKGRVCLPMFSLDCYNFTCPYCIEKIRALCISGSGVSWESSRKQLIERSIQCGTLKRLEIRSTLQQDIYEFYDETENFIQKFCPQCLKVSFYLRRMLDVSDSVDGAKATRRILICNKKHNGWYPIIGEEKTRCGKIEYV